jgi:hypothetical protein
VPGQWQVEPPIVPHAAAPFGLSHLSDLPSVALLPSPWLRCIGHPWASIVSDQIIQASEELNCPRRPLPPAARPFSRAKSLRKAPNDYSKPGLFNPWGFTAPRCFLQWGLDPAAAPRVTSPCFDWQARTPQCFHHPGCSISERMI